MGITNKAKVQLQTIISHSFLKEEQKKLWGNLIENIENSEAELILETLQDEKDALAFLTKNLDNKSKALQKKDMGAWQKIIDEEKQKIQELQ